MVFSIERFSLYSQKYEEERRDEYHGETDTEPRYELEIIRITLSSISYRTIISYLASDDEVLPSSTVAGKSTEISRGRLDNALDGDCHSSASEYPGDDEEDGGEVGPGDGDGEGGVVSDLDQAQSEEAPLAQLDSLVAGEDIHRGGG